MIFVGLAWYGFVEGDALRFSFLFAFEPVEDFLSAFLSAFFPFEFKYSTFYSAEHGSYPCRLVFTHFAFLIARRDFVFLRAVLPLVERHLAHGVFPTQCDVVPVAYVSQGFD